MKSLIIVMLIAAIAIMLMTRPVPVVIKHKHCTGYTILIKDSVVTCHGDTIKYNTNPIKNGISTNKKPA